MIIHLSKLNPTGCLILASCVVMMGAASPSMAQTVSFPSPAFPKEGTQWGCHFFGTCRGDDAVAEEK